MYNATILIIDDEQSYLNMITNALKDKNYKVLKALDGKMGCSVAEKFLPDIIIIDWEMPVMNGIDAIKYLKSIDATKDIPIIMATGIMISPQSLEVALNAGAIDYIRKPIDPTELTARINSALKLASSLKEITLQRDQLKQLNGTKDKFFSIIAHDLRNPIGSMVSFLDYIVSNHEKVKIEDYEEYFSQLNEDAKTTYELLENLLTWARSQRGEIIFSPAINVLYDLAFKNIEMYKFQAAKKNIKIENRLDKNLLAYFDCNMIDTVFRNLINNAVKYTYENGIIIISAIEIEQAITITIKDNGIGIQPSIVQHLFRIDTKISSLEGTDGERGTGLGLILCKEFIDKHHQKIWVESEYGRGSMFCFTLDREFTNQNT